MMICSLKKLGPFWYISRERNEVESRQEDTDFSSAYDCLQYLLNRTALVFSCCRYWNTCKTAGLEMNWIERMNHSCCHQSSRFD